MTDSILRSYQYYSTTSIVPFPVSIQLVGAEYLLTSETNGFAIDATTVDGGTVAVIDTGTPANNLSNVILDASNLVQSGTSPKMVHHAASPYVRWSAHNLFLNSGAPVTQNVTLVTDVVYTYGITGAGTLTGSSGASGAATSGSPVTFTATGTTGTFTVSGGTPTTMWINRGTIQVPYLATTASIRIGIPQSYDTVAAQYGILTEPAATNICTESETFSAAAWGQNNLVAAANVTTAPDGATTADRLTASAGSAVHYLAQNQTVTNPQTLTFSMYLKQGTHRYATMQSNDAVANGVGILLDLQTGTILSTALSVGSAFTYVSSSSVAIGDGWYRYAMTFTATGTVTSSIAVEIRPDGSNATWSVSWNAAGTETIFLWGGQNENGTVATSYIPTVGSSQTRATDQVNLASTTIPAFTTELSQWVWAKIPNVTTTNSLAGGSVTNEQTRFYTTSGNVKLYAEDGGTPQADFVIGSVTANTAFKVAGRWVANDFHGARDGTLSGAPDTTGTMPAPTNFKLGYDVGTAAAVPVLIYQYVVVPRDYTNSELQANST